MINHFNEFPHGGYAIEGGVATERGDADRVFDVEGIRQRSIPSSRLPPDWPFQKT